MPSKEEDDKVSAAKNLKQMFRFDQHDEADKIKKISLRKPLIPKNRYPQVSIRLSRTYLTTAFPRTIFASEKRGTNF